MVEILFKFMLFKMFVEFFKKKFFFSEEILKECMVFGVEFVKLVK